MDARPGLTGILAIILAFTCAAADARPNNVGETVDGELADYVARQLTQHPRFKGATFRFVVLRDGSPQALSSELSISLRNRLQRRVVDASGVKVAWQPSRAAEGWLPRSGVDCGADDAQYLIGLETSPSGSDRARLTVRAFDIVEKSWVAGFSRDWQVRLNGSQRRALHRTAADQTFLGDREVPYERSQTDLIAAHLAYRLRCSLMRAVQGEYRASIGADDTAQANLGRLVELVANNVAGIGSFQVVDGNAANAVLSGEAHPVNEDLFQYWITLQPTAAESDLEPLSASVYLRLPTVYLSAGSPALEGDTAGIATGTLLDSVRLIRLDDTRTCPAHGPGYRRSGYPAQRKECLALEIRARTDAVVFVLNHQQNHGLVRLGGDECRIRTTARIARANEPLTFALPANPMLDQWAQVEEWRIDPDDETYYAIAVSSSRAAREVASHLDELPRRCSESIRPGIDGRELEEWLAGLSAAFTPWQPHVDWDAIRIKNIY